MARGALRIKPGFAPKHYSWVDVGALCLAILAAAASLPEGERHGPFYPCAEETITDLDLLGTAADVIGAKGFTLPVPQAVIGLASLAVDAIPAWRKAVPSLGIDRVREMLSDRWVCDAAPFSQAFGWRQRTTLRETLLEAFHWLRIRGIV
jgi:nucleoside-diphosphate-sugar epimerase